MQTISFLFMVVWKTAVTKKEVCFILCIHAFVLGVTQPVLCIVNKQGIGMFLRKTGRYIIRSNQIDSFFLFCFFGHTLYVLYPSCHQAAPLLWSFCGPFCVTPVMCMCIDWCLTDPNLPAWNHKSEPLVRKYYLCTKCSITSTLSVSSPLCV